MWAFPECKREWPKAMILGRMTAVVFQQVEVTWPVPDSPIEDRPDRRIASDLQVKGVHEGADLGLTNWMHTIHRHGS